MSQKDGMAAPPIFAWQGKVLRPALEEPGVTTVQLASAYFSKYGLDLVQDLVDRHHLTRDKVTVFLGADFDAENPGHILRELTKLAVVYVVDKPIKLHAKVLLLGGKTPTLLFGSSNYTQGGWVDNLEFNVRERLSEDQVRHVSHFFGRCRDISRLVDEQLIQAYEVIHEQLVELWRSRLALEHGLRRALFSVDPFDRSTYDLSSRLFKFEDYEVFFDRLSGLKGGVLKDRRSEVRHKLLGIHDIVAPVAAMDMALTTHWDSRHVTSSITPNDFNHQRVGWLGVRYADQKRVNFIRGEYESLRKSFQEEQFGFGFYKHACLQFSLDASGFWVSLFHAVAHDAVDRDYVVRQWHDRSFRQSLDAEVESLCKQGYKWAIGDPIKLRLVEEYPNLGAAEAFTSFYKRADGQGVESFLYRRLSPDDPILRTADSVASFVIEQFKLLMNLYRLMSEPTP